MNGKKLTDAEMAKLDRAAMGGRRLPKSMALHRHQAEVKDAAELQTPAQKLQSTSKPTVSSEIEASKPYGCHNQPRPVAGQPVQVRDGWQKVRVQHPDGTHYAREVLVPVFTTVPYRFTVPCQSDRPGKNDPRCAGCMHATAA